MFVQIIQGRSSDAEGLRRQGEQWEAELLPGATGFLGSTGGVAADGTAILLARFESEEAAQANSNRPEQGAWWNETAKYFDGEVTFRNSTDVDTTFEGGSDRAGFVQIMQGRVTDRDRLNELEAEFLPTLKELRPDLIGSVRAWDGDWFVEAIYFTSEPEARKGEAAMAEAPEAAEGFEEYMTLVQDVSYIDLTDPWLRSP
ncbi:MAG: hypothetical protein ACRD0N_05060 [Acidimicrobiales bacterium]